MLMSMNNVTVSSVDAKSAARCTTLGWVSQVGDMSPDTYTGTTMVAAAAPTNIDTAADAAITRGDVNCNSSSNSSLAAAAAAAEEEMIVVVLEVVVTVVASVVGLVVVAVETAAAVSVRYKKEDEEKDEHQ